MIAGGCRAAAEPAGCCSWCRLPRRGCGPGSGAGGGTTDADQLRQRRQGRGGLIRAAPTIPHNSRVLRRIHPPDLRHANLARHPALRRQLLLRSSCTAHCQLWWRPGLESYR